jgi:arylsulfatase A-like enzyme
MPYVRFILFLTGFSLTVFFQAGCGGGSGSAGQDPPNILLISLDTLRADRLHCYGHDPEISPAVDALASGGALFENVYAQSPWTLPSHVSMMSSLYPSRHGVNLKNRKIPDKIRLLSEILKSEGYVTASFNGASFVSAKFGFGRGFDLYEEIPIRDGNVETIVTRFLGWLEKNRDRKFFVFLHTYETHRPLSPPAAYRKKYVPMEAIERPWSRRILNKILNDEALSVQEYGFLTALRFCREEETIRAWIQSEEETKGRLSDGEIKNILSKVLDEEQEAASSVMDHWREARYDSPVYRYLMQNYDAEIRFTDHQIGRLVESLRALGLEENTLIILTSDHGEEFAEHGNLGHGKTCYEETLRVPLILSWPGRLPQGVRIGSKAALIDLAPTILSLAGIRNPGHFDGLSLVPMIHGRPGKSRMIFSETIFEGASDRQVTAIDGEWKCHYNRQGRRPDELYHLGRDPGETVNLADEEPDILRRMKKSMDAYMEIVPEAGVEEVVQSGEIRKQLRRLGYIEDTP